MFDLTPPAAPSPSCASPRALACGLVARSGALLVETARRVGGDDGAALACALQDMIADTAVEPLHWPLEEAINLLRQPAALHDEQVERLIAQLAHIQRRIEDVT